MTDMNTSAHPSVPLGRLRLCRDKKAADGATQLACPSCSARAVMVIDTRSVDEHRTVRRRRVCRTCGHRYTTVEVLLDDEGNLLAKAGFRLHTEIAEALERYRTRTGERS